MSRTYRKHLDGEYIVNGDIIHWRDADKSILRQYPYGMGFHYRYRIIKGQRDGKHWDKPDKTFKQMKRRIERAREKQALRTDKEIPFFKKTDQWDWT